MFQMRHPVSCSLLGAMLGLVAIPAHAALNDLYPGDYLPAEAGQTAFVAYLYDRSLEGSYAQGSLNGQKNRSAQTLILLGAYYFDVAGLRANVAVSGGRSRQTTDDRATATSDRTEGTTDPKLSLTVWPYRNDTDGLYLAVNLAQVFGAGTYNADAGQNIGQHRDRSILSLAYAHRTSANTMLEVTGEAARFGANPDYTAARLRLEQRSAYAVTGFFRVRINDQFTPYVGAQQNWGGESVINGLAQGDNVRSQRAYLGLRFQPQSRHIFHLRMAKDLDADWGYGLKREWVLRWTWLPQ